MTRPKVNVVAHLRFFGRALAALVVSCVLATALALEERIGRVDASKRNRYVQRWSRSLAAIFGVRLDLEPAAHLRTWTVPPCGTLVIANHRSMMDIFLMLHLFGGRMVARGDMAKWPFIGALAKLAGTVFVDRSDKGSRAQTLLTIAKLLSTGACVGVFPEGTTFVDDEVRPFYPGSLRTAVEAHSRIVPVGIAYLEASHHFGDESFGAHLRALLSSRVVAVAVTVGEPLVVASEDSDIAEQARTVVQALVHRSRARLSGHTDSTQMHR